MENGLTPGADFWAAFAKAQAAFGKIEKKHEAKVVSQKGSYTYRYADLADIMPAILPALNKNELILTQPIELLEASDGVFHMVIKTRVVHASGQGIEGQWLLPAQQSPQQTGALLTYYRRYALCSLLGLAAEEEDGKVEESADGVDGSRQVKGRGREAKPHSGAIPMNTKHTKTALKAWLDGFVRDIHACSDQDELDALVASSNEMIAAVQSDMSNFWYGDTRAPDYIPPPKLIADKTREFADAPV